MHDLQREYRRVVRLADLSHGVSKENISKCQEAQKQLATVRHQTRPLA